MITETTVQQIRRFTLTKEDVETMVLGFAKQEIGESEMQGFNDPVVTNTGGTITIEMVGDETPVA